MKKENFSFQRLIIFLLFFILIIPPVIFGEDASLTREQDEVYDYVKVPPSSSGQEEKGEPSFLEYFFRIIKAAFATLWEYPRNEETDLHDTYLEIVNRGTDRQWKRETFKIERSQEYTEEKEGETTTSDASEGSSYENKGSSAT